MSPANREDTPSSATHVTLPPPESVHLVSEALHQPKDRRAKPRIGNVAGVATISSGTWDGLTGILRNLTAISIFGFLAALCAGTVAACIYFSYDTANKDRKQSADQATLDRASAESRLKSALDALKSHQDYVAAQQDRNTDRITSAQERSTEKITGSLDKQWEGINKLADEVRADRLARRAGQQKNAAPAAVPASPMKPPKDGGG